nr:hypothetical protein [Planctomycetota bacterium]
MRRHPKIHSLPLSALAYLLLAAPAVGALVAPPDPLPTPGAGPLGAGGVVAPGDLLGDHLWDDGLAEVSQFDLTQFRYGILHQGGQVTLVVVREFLDPRRVVKARSDQPENIPVMKGHLVKSFQTGVYRYDQSATVLMRRADSIPLRLFISSHEWCGSAGKSWINHGTGSQLRVMSYFDGHGDFEQPLELPPAGVLEDSLWLWLRCWTPEALSGKTLILIPTQLEARAQSTEPITVTVQVRSDVQETVPAGTFPAVRVTLTPVASPAADGDGVFQPKGVAMTWEFTYERAAPR